MRSPLLLFTFAGSNRCQIPCKSAISISSRKEIKALLRSHLIEFEESICGVDLCRQLRRLLPVRCGSPRSASLRVGLIFCPTASQPRFGLTSRVIDFRTGASLLSGLCGRRDHARPGNSFTKLFDIIPKAAFDYVKRFHPIIDRRNLNSSRSVARKLFVT